MITQRKPIALRHTGGPALSAGPRLPYAPGLDGLRAFAVLVVVLYHAGVSWMPGGFLGVDVFFVLSGYLITSLLLAELASNGRIRLGQFWLRRARRLLPAALLVIVVCLLVAAVFLPSDLAKARGDAIASVFYVNNWHAIFSDQSYFAAFGRPSLLQHLWSLSVEEQFYLFWPLLLGFGLLRLGRRGLAIAAAVGALVSAILMAVLYNPSGDPTRVYFGTDTRATPLLIGALLAFAWPAGRLTTRVGRKAGAMLNGVGLAGMALLLLAVTRWHDYDPWLYRGGLVIAAVASAAVVGAAVHPAARVGAILGVRPLRWIGQRSYGLYLWHWPVIALTRPGIDVSLTLWVLVPLQIAAAIGLAALSYRYVEMPIRREGFLAVVGRALGPWRPRQRLAAVAAAGVAALLVGTWAFARPVPVDASDRAVTAAQTAAANRDPTVAPASTANASAAQRGADPPLAVGASVMLAAQPALQKALGSQARIDAAVGRQVGDVIDRLEEYRDAGTLPDRVIVQTGENGPAWYTDMQRLRETLLGVQRVVLVNVRVPRSWEQQVDASINETIDEWPQARLADWYGASGAPGLLYDGAHPNPAGQKVYARIVARALRAR